MVMRVSPAGVEAIALREGCELDAYQDERGIWTIGVGHAATSGRPPIPVAGMTISMADALALLARDLAPIEADLNAWIRVKVSQNQFDACASLAFNIGAPGFQGSTVLRDINDGSPALVAADAFLMWDEPPDLLARRQGERAQFLRPDLPAPTPTLDPRAVWPIQYIQSRLNARQPFPGLEVDGDWGPRTRDAVIAFQKFAGLATDGIVGPLTKAALAKE